MNALATRTTRKTSSLNIFQRIRNKDRAAVTDCIDAYGGFIWALAKKFTASGEEAEAAAREIFIDIWRYAECGADPNQPAENLLIEQIARRRLIEYLQIKPKKIYGEHR